MPDLTYSPAGATAPRSSVWSPPPGFRHFEETVALGRGEEQWVSASRLVMEWGVKTRSGFSVSPADVDLDAEPVVHALFGPVSLREPVRVVAVVEAPDRVGFAYGTLPGHPVSGEEAFIVHRDADAAVWLTLRSLTRPAPGAWRLAFPLILLAQRLYRRRYRRALAA